MEYLTVKEQYQIHGIGKEILGNYNIAYTIDILPKSVRNTKGVIEKYISARYLLFTSLHGAVAKVMNKEHMVKNNHGVIFEPQPESEFVFKCDRFTYWWSLYINTATKVPHSKPDSVIWNKEVKT